MTSKEKQAQLITEIGEMIIDDYIAQNIDWEALGFTVTLHDGQQVIDILKMEVLRPRYQKNLAT